MFKSDPFYSLFLIIFKDKIFSYLFTIISEFKILGKTKIIPPYNIPKNKQHPVKYLKTYFIIKFYHRK